jgi:G3E family GTPase
MLSYILQHSPQTEYILIEASGLSDPDPVREALQTPPISDRAYLESTICIVDAVNFEQMRAENSIVTSQIADADLVVLSKVSQAGPEQVAQVTALLGRMVPDLRVLPFDKTLSPQIFLQGDLASQRPANQRPASKRSTSEHDHHSHDEYDVFWHTLDQPLDLDQVSAYLKNLPTNVIRIKGVIKCSSPTGQTFWVRLQRVGAHYTAEPIPEPPTEPKESTILLIGKKLDQPAIRACLTDFMALK